MKAENARAVPEDTLSLKELVAILLREKWLILGITSALTIAAATAAFLLPRSYDASVVISSVSERDSQMGGLSSLASQFGGLASLAGVSLTGESKKWESLAILKSDALTQQYIRNNNLLPVLYAHEWDAQRGSWKASDPQKIPTVWDATEYFKKKVRTVTTDVKTGLVTLTITWKDPIVAAKWANDLVKLTNDTLRTKALDESERNIAYLNDQAIKTEIVGARQAIYSILQNEFNKAMLARGSEEYAFKVLDPAVPPEEPSFPKPLVWVLLAVFGGSLLSVFMAFARAAWNAS